MLLVDPLSFLKLRLEHVNLHDGEPKRSDSANPIEKDAPFLGVIKRG